MSDNYSLIIKNGSCYINGELVKTDLALSGNKIRKIGKVELNSSKVIDATDKVVLPGIIDTQVHFREPGSTDSEDLESGSRAAVLGGVTSLFEMPNTNPPTSNLIEFDKKLQLAKDRMHSNYAFYFGATPDNIDQLSKLKNLKGCCGVKLFAGSSTGKLLVDKEADIEKVISNSDRVVSIHSEDEEILNLRKRFIRKGDVHSHSEWRNSECAISSTRRVVKIAERYNKQIHILHVTTKEEVDFLAMHKKNITFEITPQHLTLYAPDCYNALGSYAQMNPPLRTKEHYDRLWTAIKNDVVDVLGSDHAPHLKENKNKEYPNSPSGMPGVQTILPIMLNHVNNEKLSLKKLITLLCENPCKIFGIKDKGFIKEGYDADLTIVDMNKVQTIKDEMIASKCGWTPFNNFKVKGFPVGTIVNGTLIMSEGKIISKAKGQPLNF
jgi:dihydroorotase|tara:strand:- start:44 stop:1357 length:1314 start_codon:yes stop_codon:yes gene_type:complete